ncbi:hypothetical protein [Shewanella sedimentimangrovi]|uniref:Outer membrane protein beta-barrel domain-containing protein n=1 Tax=Shewanella sedimentimangrovi TaxID=2814293 RepID=A0ABX7R4I8_9GAMM|nr:hypothetical protein [Shewanella sedimentimangrovi]QSX37701.1 hypothetical protein JYB85_02340 [Shewanella sedimentimangrovi]
MATILLGVTPQLAAVTWFDLSTPQLMQYGSVGLAASYYKGEQDYGRDMSFIGDYYGRANSSGYIYRPWVLGLNVNGQLNGQLQEYDVYANQLYNSWSWGLGTGLTLYPADESPTFFNAGFSQLRSQSSTDNIFNTLSLGVSKSLNFSGNYLNSKYAFRNETESENGRDFKVHELELNYTGQYEGHSDYGSLRLDSRKASAVGLDNKDWSLYLSYNHSFNYWEKSYSNIGGSYSRSNRSNSQSDIDLSNFRVFNGNSWNFVDLPELRLSLNNQAYSLEQDGSNEGGLVNIQNLTWSSNMAADYDWSETLSSNASVLLEKTGTVGKLNGEQYFDEDSTRLVERLATRWRDNFDLGFAKYNAHAGGSFNASQGERDSQDLQLDLSHGIRRDFTPGLGSVGLSLTQSYNRTIALSANELESDRLAHSFDVNWNLGEGSTNTNIFGRISHDMSPMDSRNWQERIDVGVESASMRTSRSSFGGRMNYGWSRAVFAGSDFESQSAWGNLWYMEQDLFDIWGLLLEATLDLPLEDYFFNDGNNRNDVATLDVKLKYNLGRLEIKFNSVFSETSEFYSISARRKF